jgi:hypothetical protein
VAVEAQAAAQALGLEAGVVGDRRGQVDQIHLLLVHVAAAGLQAGQGEQLADQLVHPAGLALDALDAGLEARRVLAHQADRGLQAGQGRAQLVGDVVEQAALGADELLQLLGHAVEVAAQVGDLVAPAAHQRPHRVSSRPRPPPRRPSAGCGSASTDTRPAAR